MTEHSAPLSWRDVYRAVEKSERTILAAINDAVDPLKEDVKDHEARIRVIEQNALPAHTAGFEALRVANANAIKHDILQAEVIRNTANRQGVLSTLSGGQRLAVFVFGGLGALAVLLDIFSKYFP